MRAKATKAHGTVRAFTGREFVHYEWRPVPVDCKDEARRLEDAGYLKLKDDKPALSIPSPQVVEIDITRPASDLASMHGLDLASVIGSGARGRILVADILAILDEEE